jgi:hypothetical protein
MSTATFDMDSAGGADDALQYRSLHTGAIVGFLLSLLLLAFTLMAVGNSPEACIAVSALNAAPLSICAWSLAKMRREPELYTGRTLARVGLALSLVLLISGVVYGSYVYVTEVPDGYTRISFNAMKPDELQELNRIPVPPDIQSLDGKKVLIKGYIRPDSITVSKGIKRFLLVRDNNQCCFGTLSNIKYYDQIDVDMVGSRRVDYDQGVFKIAGVLHVNPENLASNQLKPVFTMDADLAD